MIGFLKCPTCGLDTWAVQAVPQGCAPCRKVRHENPPPLLALIGNAATETPDLDYKALKAVLVDTGGRRGAVDAALNRRAVRREMYKALPSDAVGYYMGDQILILYQFKCSNKPAGAVMLRLD